MIRTITSCLTKSIKNTVIPGSGLNHNPLFGLPTTGITLLVGETVKIYGDNLINWPVGSNYSADFTCDIGTDSGNYISFTPIAGDIGSHNLTISFKDNGKEFLNKTITINVMAKEQYWNASVLCIGDSTLSGDLSYEFPAGTITGIGPTLESNIPVNNITWLGHLGTAPYYHAAIAGASMSTMATGLGAASPFVKDGVLNIPAYFEDNLIAIPDIVYIRLGINDVNYYTNFDRIMTDANVATILGHFDDFINGFLAFNPDLKVIVALPTNATSVVEKWGYDPILYPQNNYIKNVHKFWIALVNRYANNTYDSRVDMSYEAIFLDRITHYSNGLHFDDIGNKMLGKTLAPYINRYFNNILNNENNIGVYDFLDTNHLIKDESNNIDQITDQYGTGETLSQTLTKRPQYNAEGAIFDGINDGLIKKGLVINQPTMTYIVMKQKTWTALRTFFTIGGGYVQQSGTLPNIRGYAGVSGAGDPNLAIDTWAILRVVFNGENSYLIVNENDPTTGNWGNNNGTVVSIGTLNDNDKYSNIQVKGAIFQKAIPSAAKSKQVYEMLKAKYALVI